MAGPLDWMDDDVAPPPAHGVPISGSPEIMVPAPATYRGEDGASPLAFMDDVAPEPSRLDRFVGNVRQPIQPITEAPGVAGALRGANEQIAKLLGFPLDVVNDALYLTGLKESPPGGATQAVLDTFKSMGIRLPAGAQRTLDEKIGAEVITQLVGYGAARLAAPTLAAGKPGVLQSIGAELEARPVTGAVASVTSAPGVVVGGQYGKQGVGAAGEYLGENVGGEEGARIGRKLGEGVGEAFGSLAGGVATSVLGAPLLRSVIPDVEKGGFKPFTAPLIDPDAMPSDAVASAKQAVTRQLEAVDRRIVQTIERVNAQRLSPAKAAAWLRTSLERTYSHAREIENSAWDQVDKNTPIDLAPVWQVMQRQMTDNWEGAKPAKIIKDFMEKAIVQSADGDVDVVAQPFSWVRQLRSNLRVEIMNNAGSVPAAKAQNRDMQGALTEIEQAVMASISRSIPEEAAWVRARQISQTINERFTRGPIGQLLALDHQASDRIPAELTAKTLLQNPGGVAALLKSAEPVSQRMGPIASGGQPGVRMTTAEPLPAEPRQAFSEASRQTVGTPVLGNLDAAGRARNATGLDAAIRSEFEDAAKAAAKNDIDMGRRSVLLAKGGEDFAKEVREDIDRLAGVSTDIKTAGQTLGRLWRAREAFEKSAVARFAERDPDKAIADIFNQQDPAAAAKDLLRKMRGDPDAVAGLRAGIVQHFMGLGGNRSLAVANRRLAEDTRWGRVFQEVLGASDSERFRNMVAAGARLETGDTAMATRAAAGVTSWLAGWVGLTTGHIASKLNPSQAGALSYPSQMKRTFQNMAAKAFDYDNPWSVLAQAVNDPKQEAFLMSQMPFNAQTGRAAERQLRRAFIAGRALYEHQIDSFDKRERGEE